MSASTRQPARPIAAVLAGLACLLAPAAAPAAAADGVSLRYALRPGAVYEGTMRATLATHVTMEGLPEEAAAMMRALLGDASQRTELRTILRTGEPAADRGLPVELTLSGGVMEMTLAGQTIEIPGAREALAASPSWSGRLSPDGRAVELDPGSAKGAPGLPPDTADRVMQALPPRPERTLRPGDTFEVVSRGAVPGLPMAGRIPVASKIVFTLKSAGEGEARFDTESTVTSDASGEATPRMKVKLSGRGAGHATFDLREGHFTSLAADVKIDAEIEVPLPTEPDPAPGGSPGPPGVVRIHATLQGPTGLTMSRKMAPASTGS
ncbi:MAG: hypothetical protein HY049_19925 [Acidobacteria bacterium]|nr:hypothetical protein [Acidobacteriota bacterium]